MYNDLKNMENKIKYDDCLIILTHKCHGVWSSIQTEHILSSLGLEDGEIPRRLKRVDFLEQIMKVGKAA
jgi:hypothetical protein